MAAGFVVVLCFCVACVSGPSAQDQTVVNNTSVTNVGLVPITGTGLHESYTLEEAADAVTGEYQQNQINGSSQNLPFYYIQGKNMDATGKAERWLFGIREGNSTTMLVYDRTGVARIPLQENGLPTQEIDISSILLPADIIKIAYPQNQNITGNLELAIAGGEYILTGSSGSQPGEYSINATTGVLITTHD